MKHRLVYVFTLIIAIMLSACGFHLRGSGNQANLPFKTIYISVAESSLLGNELKRYIGSSGGTTVATDPKAAEATLEILSESRDKTVLSLNSQGRVREYALYSKVTFLVKDKEGNSLLPPTEVAIRRTLSFNESQVLAKENEEAMLYRDMQTDVVQQILRRVSAIKPL